MQYHYQRIYNSPSHWSFKLHMESSEKHNSDLIIPDGTPGLMYIKEGRLQRRAHGVDSYFESGVLYLFGQKTNSVQYFPDRSGLHAFGLKLAPASIYRLFGISAHEITDKAFPLKDVDPDYTFEIDEDAGRLTNWEREEQGDDPLLQSILYELHNSHGTQPVQSILDKFNIGYKRLQRLFNLHIGITPKAFARILRLNYSIMLGYEKVDRLTDLAYQSGFFDQNHFIKEIKHFTGQCPSELFNPQRSILKDGHLAFLNQRHN